MASRINQHWSVVGLTVFILVITGALSAQLAHAQCQYDVTIIQAPECPPFGPQATFATGINEHGHVVGYHCQCICGSNEAFVWTPESGLITLDFPPGTASSLARDINDVGQIVGEYDIPGDGFSVLAFLRDGEEFIEIPPPSGGTFSQAQAINTQGQVVGTTADGKTPYFKAFLWEEEVMTLLEPTFGPRSSASDINDPGQIVGWMGTAPISDARAFIGDDGEVTNLGPIPAGFTSEARGVNNATQVVGLGRLQGNGSPLVRAFLWQQGEMIDLGTLPGFDRCAAVDINDAGQVIGGCDQSSNPNNNAPFLWREGVMMHVNELILDDLGLDIRDVSAINNKGQIVGTANGPEGTAAVLLTPVVFPLGDLDGDCRVDAWDLALLLGSWGPCAGCPADLNGDGGVGAADLAILLGNWG